MINYVIGDATYPQGDGMKIVAHVCNNIGAWGAGFTGAINARWEDPETNFRWWASRGHVGKYYLGRNQYVQVEQDIYVANMVAQDGIVSADNPQPLSYYALEACLNQLNSGASYLNASVHMPRIGTGLAGGSWDEIEPIINRTLPNLSVTVYDLE